MAKLLSETLKELRGGAADIDAGALLGELIQAVRETGRGGSVVVEVRVRPLNQGDGTQVLVEDVTKVKKPASKPTPTVFFTNEEGLTRRDPRQPELSGLREVAAGGAVVRDFTKVGE